MKVRDAPPAQVAERHIDQAQPRRVSGVGWSDGLCGLTQRQV